MTPATPGPHRILVVDDTPANLALLIDALTEAGHEILVAESGRSALALLEHAIPDLVLLDVLMPGLDGYETCAQLRTRPACADVPVIFLTAVDEPDYRLKAFAAGAVDYITKPVFPPEVLARVATHLRLRDLQRSLADELALRIEAEAQLGQSLDRAVVLVDGGGRVLFATRLAIDLLHQFLPGFDGTQLPAALRTGETEQRITSATGTLVARAFTSTGERELVVHHLAAEGDGPGPAALLALGLTTREAEVLYWIAQGKSNPDIAVILGAGLRTIHKHVEHIFQKLGVETRAAAALNALDILRPPR